jgi:hypothetical protein
MAKLFLSYSRKDASRARHLTEWLERHDHDVWRDEDDIRGGASFSNEIEEALEDCDAVLVLWSAESVKSPWVRDEAGFGRDNSKLIPIALDGILPPLGFRQFQSIDLAKWKGKGEPPRAEQILRAIDTAKRGPGAGRASFAAKSLGPARSARQLPLRTVGLAVLAVLIAGAGFMAWRSFTRNSTIAIAVAPSPTSPDRATATDYANVAAADMAAFLPRRFDRASVIAPGDTGQTSAYRMQVSTTSHGAEVSASLTLSDVDGRTTLWSKNWDVPDAATSDLKAQVSAAASKAALCLTDARGGRSPLSQPALGLYLNGCVALGDTSLSNADFEALFARLTKLAPDFAPAWDYLALSRSWIAGNIPPNSPARAAALKGALDAIGMARKLNPNSAMTYDAEYHLNSGDTFQDLQILEKGAKIDPDDGRIQMHLSDEYLFVGRMADSVQAAQRGIELEPSEPYMTSQYILALTYSGEFSKAKAAIADARKRWPNDSAVDYADFCFQFRYGDPRVALTLLPRATAATDADMVPYQKFIAARLDPTKAKIDEAIASLTAGRPDDVNVTNKTLLALADFGRVNEVYELLDDPASRRLVARDALFRPEFKAVRADPRFMQVAAMFGLARYWRGTGYWPDFCSAERLPYDCKTEAAKYR